MSLSHDERAARRDEIREYCRTHSRAEAAQAFGVCLSTVAHTCAGLRQQSHMPAASSFAILNRLMKGERQGNISEAMAVSQQRVQQISARAAEAGIELPCHEYRANRRERANVS